MDDPLRPNKADYDRVLFQRFQAWSSYLEFPDASSLLPWECFNLKGLLQRMPSFLGCSLLFEDARIPLSLVEKGSREGQYGLISSCRSIWRTTASPEQCSLKPKALPTQLVVGVQSSLSVYLSDSAPLTEWPGTRGISGQDEGNYLAVLFLAWAYILSARWAELMERVPGCRTEDCQLDGKPNDQYAAVIGLGYPADSDEAGWWAAILSGSHHSGTVEHNQRTYLSPWSVRIAETSRIAVADYCPSVAGIERPPPPSSCTALGYLSRLCARHRLYGQCSAALAAVLYVPFLRGKAISLPVPRQVLQPQAKPTQPIDKDLLIAEHGRLLPYYMTLSTNVWGMRSLLCSTFFNADIACNLVIIDPLLQANDMPALVRIFARRAPRLGSLWLGAVIVDMAKSTLRDVRNGLTALDLSAAAWTGTDQSYITLKSRPSDGTTIRREDECRLLFLTGCDGFTRAPIYPWKPFGTTLLCDTEPQVQQHADCGCHGLVPDEYSNALDTHDGHEQQEQQQQQHAFTTMQEIDQYSSESLSEAATRGIFNWLRSTGYPADEKPIYQHSWIDLESSDEEGDDEAGAEIDSDSVGE
ncbi:hypothetical protein BO82DRAFT_433275 [Aspergillus uvarum CBS 121591]|uniref:Uncharacterized protein n=1 Tax=Aspergillus uvarum CBS 121591 TaxID=1448315 RepID=A0A319CXV3_9EURO|nr:hypothetical protein BO82DRAFT_433275 [Aspergillus uvarum CBS 121591]PYH80478.1 hypothetical protein BO82DRAFT_433275 [Aspergillus uvarum CBS 121591]